MFEITAHDSQSRARTGKLTTPHGIVETPSYVVVATDGAIRTLNPEDIPETRTQMVISNTYHLWRSLGEDGLSHFPGLHAVMEWNGSIMTDSGGFQVFSLGYAREHGVSKVIPPGARDGAVPTDRPGENLVRVTDSGVYFMDGEEELYLDAELSIKIQEQLGADIVLAFDECPSPLHGYEYQKEAMERTHRWAERSLEAKHSLQKIYGIVQGGNFKDLREESARVIGGMPFDGFAIGGSFGKEEMADVLGWTIPLLPNGKPRHLLGIGRIEDVFMAVEQGVDTFDCVIPTREARHKGIWTPQGRYDISRGKHASETDPLDPECGCPVCAGGVIRRKDVHELFRDKNPEAGRLATIHNIFFFNALLEDIRTAIRGGRFMDMKREYLGKLV